MTEAELRAKVVGIMQGWVGYNESNGKFKTIIDLYNSHTPLARGYKVQYTDAWCATAVSAAFIKAGLTDIGPTECSCSKMIALHQALGQWKETDSYTPSAGDLIMYDWDDSGSGDNTGAPEHVGMVEKVSGSTITVIEGNKSEAVARRTMTVNGKYIRGYCLPDYASKATSSASSASTASVKVDSAKSFNKASYAKTWTVTASMLNMRSGAGTGKTIITTLAKGTKFICYGYYTKASDGTIWLYGVANGKTGYCSKNYLK